MIPNTALINFLRTELDYHYKWQSDRICLYRKRGSTSRVEVRRITMHDETVVRSMLLRAGARLEDVERFIAQYKVNQH